MNLHRLYKLREVFPVAVENRTSDKKGQQQQAVIEAVNREEALKQLHNQNIRPLSIKAAVLKTQDKNRFGFTSSVKPKELVIFTRQLPTMISAGVPLNQSLATLQNQADGKYFKKVLAQVSKDVQEGTQLGVAFSKYPNVFSDVYVTWSRLVKPGESLTIS